MEGTQLKYVIKFVADMDKAVKFHRDVLGLRGEIRIAGLERVRNGRNHARSAPGFRQEPSRESRIGFTVADVEAFYRDMSAKGVFSVPPKKQDFGGVLAQFVDSEGAHCSVGAEAA